ncbi:MAG: NAD-dependent epimerase/dehydratase family protein [Chthoniobacterales bacterium]
MFSLTSTSNSNSASKRLLITGSTGFVGRNLLLHALKDPTYSQIILPVRNEQKLHEQLQQDGITDQQYRLHICSVSNNQWNLNGVKDLDLAIHCAGLTFSRDRDPYFKTNVEGTLRLLESLPERCRLLVLSSQSAAGPSTKRIPTRREQDLEAPITWYGESKLAMEKELFLRASERLLMVRPPMILGPRDSATLPLFKMARGLVRLKPGFATKEYSWIAVDDLCQALLSAAAKDWRTLPQHLYFLTHPKIITDVELLETTAAVVKAHGITLRLPHAVIQLISAIADRIPRLREALPSLGRDRVKEIFEKRWVVDGSAFEQDFEWKATASLCETLKQTASYLNFSKKN